MLRRKLSKSRDDVRFDYLGLLVRLGGVVCEDRGAEIRVVYRVMYRDGKLEASLVGEERTRDTSPHRLKNICACEKHKKRANKGEDKQSGY